MSNYEDIYGKRVKELSADPTLNSSYEGQVWYNSTEGVLKTVATFGSWISGSNVLNGASSRMGLGTNTAALVCGGADSGGNKALVEEYDGNGYFSGTNMPGDRQDGGSCGTTTAGLVWCGEVPGNTNTTIEWNGSSWTSSGNYPLSLRGTKGSGTQTAAISNGGDNGTTANTTTAEYNGSVWQTGEALPVGRIATASSGPQTSALITTGQNARPNPSVSNLNTSYDGASWTIETVYPTSLRQAAGTGTSNSANLVAGGVGATPFGSAVNTAAQWNGSSWTSTQTMVEGVTHGFGAGTSTQSITGSGAKDYPVYPTATQEFNTTINTITAAAFSAGGTMGTARSRGTGGGTTNAGIFANGQNVNVEEYNGTSWSEQNNMPTSLRDPSGFGTQTAFVGCAGYNPGPGNIAATHEYDGTNWTTTNNMNTARASAAPIAAGITTAGLVAQNDQSPYKTVESYNGSTWTTESSVANGRSRGNMTGTESAAFLVNGYGVDPGSPQPGVSTTTTENYNGSTWTAGTSSLQGTLASLGMANGNQDNTTIAGGFDQHPAFVRLSTVQNYNGTSWVTQPSMGTARYAGTGGGTPSGGFVAGGSAPSGTTGATEELEPETTAVTAKTLTSS